MSLSQKHLLNRVTPPEPAPENTASSFLPAGYGPFSTVSEGPGTAGSKFRNSGLHEME